MLLTLFRLAKYELDIANAAPPFPPLVFTGINALALAEFVPEVALKFVAQE